jgi:cell cycle protein kinase DBF2
MPKKILTLRNKATHVKNERDVLARGYESPWLVHLMYSFQDENSLYLAMEYVPGGDMRALLDNIGVMASECVLFYAAQMIMCVHSLHRLGYIHRDIKPANFLVDKSGFLKLADFGLSKYYGYTPPAKNEEANAMQIVGSPDYIAVEVLRRETCDLSADWWSFGVIMYEMLAGSLPFDADDPVVIFTHILHYKFVL